MTGKQTEERTRPGLRLHERLSACVDGHTTYGVVVRLYGMARNQKWVYVQRSYVQKACRPENSTQSVVSIYGKIQDRLPLTDRGKEQQAFYTGYN